jgi:hypothetical protein
MTKRPDLLLEAAGVEAPSAREHWRTSANDASDAVPKAAGNRERSRSVPASVTACARAHPTNPLGWWAAYFPTVMDGAVLRLRPPGGGAEVNASRSSVGGSLADDGSAPAVILDAAWRVYEALRDHRGSDKRAAIEGALGEGWSVDHPAIFEKWPPVSP